MSITAMKTALEFLETEFARTQAALIEELRTAIQEAEACSPYGWMIEGSHQAFFGPYAEQDAKAEAKRIGGTCKAFPVYLAPQPAPKHDPVVGTKTWFDGEKVITQNLTASDVYAVPAAQPAKPLTNDEIKQLAANAYSPYVEPMIVFARAIEAAHGIKEQQ